MHHIVGIRKFLICIYRSSLIFCFTLSIGCKRERCTDHHSKGKALLLLGQQTGSRLQASLAESNVTQQDNNPEEADQASLYGLEHIESSIKKEVKRRVAKVKEDKQAIVLLHGLHRVPYDFDAMKAVLKRKFPRAIIVALASVAKDLNKKGTFFPSPTVVLSIKEQAKLAYEEIKTKVGYGKHIVLVGHSQGGLRAFTLVKQHRHHLKSENGIVINQLITIATPWQGAPVMDHIKNPKDFNQKFKKIKPVLDSIQKNYSEAVVRYLVKFMPGLANGWSWLYAKVVPYFMVKRYPGVADLELGSNFIRNYVALGIKEIDLPITAIAGVLTDFSKLFEPFPSSIGPQALAELNATYATLIGGDPGCAHDMLLPVATQHAEGLIKENFKCIKVYGACHGNKVGVSVKRGLAELNNKEVIQRVVESIEEAFYEEKKETFVAAGEGYPLAA